jgi:type I restriction enzyme, R subunit
MNITPEQQARLDIDAALEAAGWILQNRDGINLAAGPGVALREAKMASDHGFADDLLFVNGKVETWPGDETDDELIAALAAIR